MTITPAGPRLAVVDPPADPPTGLILPPGIEDVDRGIVTAVGTGVELGIETGDLVFYHAGHFVKIGDVKIITADCVLAFDDSGRQF